MDIFTCIFGSVSYKVLIPFFIESIVSTSIPPDGKLLPPDCSCGNAANTLVFPLTVIASLVLTAIYLLFSDK